MSFAKTYSAQTSLLATHTVTVEVDLSRGLHAFATVGLPDKAVEESRDRVSAAIKNSGFASPKSQNQKIVISLAPADIRKEGPCFDVPIALSYLLANEQISFSPEKKLFVGELSLDGSVRPVRGILPIAIHAKTNGFSEMYIPEENAAEAAIVEGIAIYPVHSLGSLVEHLDEKSRGGEKSIQHHIPMYVREKSETSSPAPTVDLSDIRGNESAKRGLEIAAAGGHNIAFWGPPGTGKTLLAKSLTGILPPLAFPEALEVTSIHSIAGAPFRALITDAPFRAPHHTSSPVSIIGGGSPIRPGEITLSHRGVLFLDEFPEFDRRVIESLRQPLEERHISIARASGSARLPADILLVAAMNPCPCGNWGNEKTPCICTPQMIIRYQRKVSGPIVDRIDLWIEVDRLDHERLSEPTGGETSAVVRRRIAAVRATQKTRFAGTTLSRNSDIGVKDIDRLIPLSVETRSLLNTSAARLDLSARSYHRIIKIARTIADLEGAASVESSHVLEALRYRPRFSSQAL